MLYKNKRAKYFRELAGLRVVSMYMQEFFHWGWQQIDQQNDDGIDGYVIVRDSLGKDMGCNIRVQVKSGPSFLSSRVNDGKQVKILPYSSAEKLQSHMDDYKKSVMPVIMVWVNTQRIKPDGTVYEDLLHPEVWWERMDNYNFTGGTVLLLSHKLGEHSKGDWFDTVKPLLKNWQNHPMIEMDAIDRKLYNSRKLAVDAKKTYDDWKTRSTVMKLQSGKTFEIAKTRIGWRHINYNKRGNCRINNSLKLLTIAEKIIQYPGIIPLRLSAEKVSRNGCWVKYGLRARLKLNKDTTQKVQVVVLRKVNGVKGIDHWEFFSVHVIK